jgi:hypothetical protein
MVWILLHSAGSRFVAISPVIGTSSSNAVDSPDAIALALAKSSWRRVSASFVPSGAGSNNLFACGGSASSSRMKVGSVH